MSRYRCPICVDACDCTVDWATIMTSPEYSSVRVVHGPERHVLGVLCRIRSYLSRAGDTARAADAAARCLQMPVVGDRSARIADGWRWANSLAAKGRITAFWRRNPSRAEYTLAEPRAQAVACGQLQENSGCLRQQNSLARHSPLCAASHIDSDQEPSELPATPHCAERRSTCAAAHRAAGSLEV